MDTFVSDFHEIVLWTACFLHKLRKRHNPQEKLLGYNKACERYTIKILEYLKVVELVVAQGKVEEVFLILNQSHAKKSMLT